jgi:hypothetical protein
LDVRGARREDQEGDQGEDDRIQLSPTPERTRHAG